MIRSPFLSSFLLLLLALLLSLAIGSVFLTPNELWQTILGHGTETATSILWKIRLPRTILIALTGAALGGSGATYQGLFRNPLADPFLIGVASGAGLGAVIAMSIQWPYSLWGLMAIPLSAFIAALLTVFIVYSLARVGQTVPTTNLILAGVAFSSFATSLTSFLMLRSTNEVRRALGWLLGGAFVGAALARPGAWVLLLALAYALFVLGTAALVALLQELLGRLLRGRRMREVMANTREAKQRIRTLPKDVAYANAVLTFALGETLALVPRERADYSAIADWIVAQPWSDGKVGMYGDSWQAQIQFIAASSNNPHLKAIIPAATWMDNYTAIMYPGGVYDKAFINFFAWTQKILSSDVITPVDRDRDGALLAQARQERTQAAGPSFADFVRMFPFRDSAMPNGMATCSSEPPTIVRLRNRSVTSTSTSFSRSSPRASGTKTRLMRCSSVSRAWTTRSTSIWPFTQPPSIWPTPPAVLPRGSTKGVRRTPSKPLANGCKISK